MQQQPFSPMHGFLFGVTHDVRDGSLIARAPKSLKLGTGIPKGPAVHVWLQQEPGQPKPRWHIQLGYKKDDTKVARIADRAEAEAKFWEILPKAPKCPYPRRVQFFMFTRPMLIDGVETFVPDFDAIQAHGPVPTSVEILILEDKPLRGAYEMYTSSQLLCRGDGKNAMRVLSLAQSEEEKAAASLAMQAGEKTFPILNGCKTYGCPYSMAGEKNGQESPAPCKPSLDFKFQLIGALRLGGTCFLHTSSEKSAGNLFGGLAILHKAFGHISGIPLRLSLQAWKSNHNGKPASQVAYRLDFDAPSIEAARQKVLEGQRYFVDAVEGRRDEIRLIDAPDDEQPDAPMQPAAITAEFYPEAAGEEDPATEAPSAPIAAASETKTAALGEKMAEARKRTRAQAAVPPTAPAAVPAPELINESGPEPARTQAPASGPEDLF